MDDSQKRKSRLELGHVLFIDIAGYSKLTTEEESEALPKLNRIVRDTDAHNIGSGSFDLGGGKARSISARSSFVSSISSDWAFWRT